MNKNAIRNHKINIPSIYNGIIWPISQTSSTQVRRKQNLIDKLKMDMIKIRKKKYMKSLKEN